MVDLCLGDSLQINENYSTKEWLVHHHHPHRTHTNIYTCIIQGTLIWPQYIEKLYYNGASFWSKPDRMWKARRKIRLLYYILPTQLRDQLPAVRFALNTFVWAMRRLLGQVHSFDEAVRMKILPGSRSVDKRSTPLFQRQVVLGLILLTGCYPLGHINPGAHHFCHVGKFTFTHSILTNLWMMGFERTNLFLKNLIRTGLHVDIHLANAVAIDMAASYYQLFKQGINYDITKAPQHTCFLRQKINHARFSRREVGDLRMTGCVVQDELSVNAFSSASILGVRFRAGQWGQHPTCSSVFTCVLNGRSVYGYVNRFLSVDDDSCPGYASVCWFGPPHYPLGDNRLEVVVSGDGTQLDREIQSCIIKITQIDPSYIVVEPVANNCYRMMRQSGYDTVRTV